MKMKDIISEEEILRNNELFNESRENKKEDISFCDLCESHRRAGALIPDSIECPHCGHLHIDSLEDSPFYGLEYKAIGEANQYHPDHNIGKYPLFECVSCNNYFCLMPQKVSWNANHDVYYTGGRVYLDDAKELELFKKVETEIAKSLQQWIDRYEAGEKLKPSYPALWMKRDIQECLAAFLFEKGLKK